ncbi:UNVERIFIED_CONTAM: hypothetical protein GTU68_029527, partial [Idotea baltica]|nr:hypothetical protein [Idotea baltica]
FLSSTASAQLGYNLPDGSRGPSSELGPSRRPSPATASPTLTTPTSTTPARSSTSASRHQRSRGRQPHRPILLLLPQTRPSSAKRVSRAPMRTRPSLATKPAASTSLPTLILESFLIT